MTPFSKLLLVTMFMNLVILSQCLRDPFSANGGVPISDQRKPLFSQTNDDYPTAPVQPTPLPPASRVKNRSMQTVYEPQSDPPPKPISKSCKPSCK